MWRIEALGELVMGWECDEESFSLMDSQFKYSGWMRTWRRDMWVFMEERR